MLGTPMLGTPMSGTPMPGTPMLGTPMPGTPMPGTPMPGTPISAHLNIPVLRIQAPGILTAPPAPMFRRSDIPALRRFHAYRISDSVVECHQSALAICQPAVAGADFSQKKQVFFDKYRGKIALREAVYFPSVLPLPESKGGDRNRTTIIRQQTSDSRIRMANIGRQASHRQTSDGRHQIAEIGQQKSHRQTDSRRGGARRHMFPHAT